MQKEGVAAGKIQEAKASYDQKSIDQDHKVEAYLAKSKYAGKVGVFEGAGYMSKGMYRPTLNCIMFSRTNYFCPVCQDAIKNIIHLYAE